MRSAHYSMTANDIYRFAAAMLQPQLKWHDHGPRCTVMILLLVYKLPFTDGYDKHQPKSRGKKAIIAPAIKVAIKATT